MARATAHYPDEWQESFRARVAALYRSESSHLVCLIEQDLRAAGVIPSLADDHSAQIAEVQAALAADKDIWPEIKAVISDRQRAQRKRRAVA